MIMIVVNYPKPPPKQTCGLLKKGNYFECFPPKRSSFTESCRKANIHMDAGLFGRLVKGLLG